MSKVWGLGIAIGVFVAMPAVAVEAAARPGERLFTTKGCVACHAFKGHEGAKGTMGPDLSKYYKAKPPHDPEELAEFIRIPQAVRPGTPMPNLGLTNEEAKALAAYVLSGRKPAPRP